MQVSVSAAPIAEALKRVRTHADIMPAYQLEQVLVEQLGPEWEAKFAHFGRQPVAAASIGQVHMAALHDGREVAVKVQYPGVATSINSDLANLERLVSVLNVAPQGLFIEPLMIAFLLSPDHAGAAGDNEMDQAESNANSFTDAPGRAPLS